MKARVAKAERRWPEFGGRLRMNWLRKAIASNKEALHKNMADKAEERRLSDLRIANTMHQAEVASMRVKHATEMAAAEARRVSEVTALEERIANDTAKHAEEMRVYEERMAPQERYIAKLSEANRTYPKKGAVEILGQISAYIMGGEGIPPWLERAAE